MYNYTSKFSVYACQKHLLGFQTWTGGKQMRLAMSTQKPVSKYIRAYSCSKMLTAQGVTALTFRCTDARRPPRVKPNCVIKT